MTRLGSCASTRHFAGDAVSLAIVQAALGIGIIVGGVLLGLWGGFKRRIYTSLLGLGAMGAGLIAVGLMPASVFWGGVAAIGILGVMLTFWSAHWLPSSVGQRAPQPLDRTEVKAAQPPRAERDLHRKDRHGQQDPGGAPTGPPAARATGRLPVRLPGAKVT